MNSKFALHNYAGTPVRHFLVEQEDPTSSGTTAKAAPSHHIAVLDVSGSMWGELAAVKSTIEKVFTAEEFNDPNLLITLMTYSSSGDVHVHFERVTVAQVMAPNSPHLNEIRNLRVRGLTCISQAMVAAEKLIDDNETTCISLHSDGYANDRSPYAEAQAILGAVQELEKHPNVFCNTVAYRSYSDFALLSAVSNRLSGICTQAASARQVYEALHAAQTLLAGTKAPAIEAGIGNFDFVAFVSKSAKKVLGGTETLNIRGLAASDDATVYRYKEVTEIQYEDAMSHPVADNAPILAFCRSQISLGNLNAAKYAMVSTRIGTGLIDKHARALVGAEIAAMASDVESFLFGDSGESLRDGYGLGDTGPSILSLLNVLNTYRSSLSVNLKELAANYKRRGLKRVAGSRDDKGDIVPPAFKLQTPRDATSVPVASIDINRDTATVNIKLVQDGTLMETATGNAVDAVAGIKLDLKDFRNYTIVGDGVVNTPVLPIFTSDKRCFAALKKMGLVSGTFDPIAQIDLAIGQMPLVDYDQDFGAIAPDTFESLAKLTVLQKLLAGLTKGESEALTPDQITALKEHHISPALYFTPPTTVPYGDLAVAIGKGEVDTRLSYKVKFGTPDITNVGKLKSGNAYLQRRFTLTDANGDVIKKPKLTDWWADGNVWALKTLSARTKLDAVDDLTFPHYAGFLGLGDDTELHNAFVQAHVEWDDIRSALDGGLDRDEAVEVFKEASRKVNNAIDVIYETELCPVAFYVGATGLVPDQLDAKALTPDELVAKHPAVKLAKAEKEGTFYEVGDLLLGVFVKGEHFSTPAGVKVASALAAN